MILLNRSPVASIVLDRLLVDALAAALEAIRPR